jgi:uncharacterized membrane protein
MDMQKDTDQLEVKESHDNSGGYTSPTQPQQPPGFYNIDQEGSNYPQYYQLYQQGLQQDKYWQQQPFGVSPCYDVGPYELTSIGIRARTAGWLSYLFGWVTGLAFFLLEKENRFVRFHAMQSMLFFGGFSILEEIIRFFYGVGLYSSVLGLVAFIFWIVLMVRACKGVYYKLPVIGDLADKLINQIHV